MAAAALWLAADPAPVRQPLPFSHKTHAGVGLKCADCHASPDPGELMTFPATAKCMSCHMLIAKDKPAIVQLAAHARAKSPVPWVRVYQIPSYVFFSHRVHMESGAKCESCHGPVAEREVLAKEKDISMGACMTCHRQNKASLDCNYCHDARQP